MKSHTLKLSILSLLIFILVSKHIHAQEITYLDWGYCKICYDPRSVVMEEKLIRVTIVNNFTIPLETDFGITDKTVFYTVIYKNNFEIRSKVFYLSSGERKESYNIEKYKYSRTKYNFIYELKELLCRKYRRELTE